MQVFFTPLRSLPRTCRLLPPRRRAAPAGDRLGRETRRPRPANRRMAKPRRVFPKTGRPFANRAALDVFGRDDRAQPLRRPQPGAGRARAGRRALVLSGYPQFSDLPWRRSAQQQPALAGFAAGPKLGLTYHDDSGYGFELSYFDVLGLSAAKAVGPGDQSNWLVMKAPGTFWQTQDYAYQAMAWRDVTSLYSFEANRRLDLSSARDLAGGVTLASVERRTGWDVDPVRSRRADLEI